MAALFNNWSDGLWCLQKLLIHLPVRPCLAFPTTSLFSFGFIVTGKNVPYFNIYLDLRRILISIVSSWCCLSVISVKISSFSFVCCDILLNSVSFVKPRRQWESHLRVSPSNVSAVIVFVDNEKKISKN